MARKIIAASIGYSDPTASPQGGVLYVSTEGFTTSSGDTPASTWFQGRLSGDISFKWRVAAPFTGSKPVAGIGALKIANNDGALDDAIGWEFRDGAVTIKMLDAGQDWSAGTTIATAIAERMEFLDQSSMRIVLRDPAAILDQPIQQSTFTVGEAPDAENKLKPFSFGTPLSVDPVLIDKSARDYCIHDGAIIDIDKVRDNGLEVSFAATTTGFTLTADPAGKITADPVATAAGALSAIDTGVITDGATLSNLDRTIQNPNRIFNSPKGLVDITGHSTDSKSASAGGKYYFEVYSDRAVGFVIGADFPDGSWSISGGIGVSIPTNAHRINNADEYAFWVTGTLLYSTWQDGTEIDNDQNQNPEAGGTNDGNNWGVLVNFDDMEVSFRLNGVTKGTTLSITANSPLDSFFPLIAVSSSSNVDVRSQDNKASLYLHDENLSETIPTGYVSWSGSAYAATTGFTEFITSITDKIAGLTVDTTTQTEIDDIGYSYSYYLKDSRSASRVLFEGCASHSGWYYIGRTGSLTFGRLVEPSGDGVATFTDAEIISIVSIGSDFAPGLSNRMGALRNWTKLNIDSIDTSLAEDIRVLLSDQFQHEATTSTVLASGYNHATGGKIQPTYFRTSTDADTEIDRLITLYSQERRVLVVDAVFDLAQFILMDLGDTVSISFNRYGFGLEEGSGAFSSAFSSGFDLGSAGTQYLLLGIEGNFVSNRIRLTLWG